MAFHSLNFSRVRSVALGLALGLIAVATAQTEPGHVNKANWKLANRFTNESLRPFLYSSSLNSVFINKSDRFWYSWRDSKGTRFWLVDPTKAKKEPLFDSAVMAGLLSEALSRPYDTTNLPITTVVFDEKDEDIVRFTVENTRFEYSRKNETLKNLGRVQQGQGGEGTPPGAGQGGRGRGGQGGPPQGGNQAANFRNYSPDRKFFAYAQDHNLYVVEVTDNKEGEPIQLTKDGAENFSFGSRPRGQQQQEGQAAGEQRVRANVVWSKDSKRFYVMRFDSRKVKDLWLVNSLSEPRPTLMTYKYSMPGEEEVTQVEMFSFDTTSKSLKKLPVEKYRDQSLRDIHWQDATSDKLRFARRDRLQRNFELCEIDLTNDKVEILLTEKVENAFLELQGVRYVKPGGDFIWFSERNGWGHFYLYDNSGKLKNAITKGPWRADSIVDVDEEKGLVYFRAVGREEGENPYYRHLYRAKLDGSDLTLLDSENADHSSVLSTSKKYIVDTFSRTDMPTKVLLRDDKGRVIMPLEEQDLTRLIEAGWKMPEAFVVKAADGVTDIYGNMWKPADFDPKKRYPIIANVYPGPQTESVSSTFSATATNQRLAQLGFIVIQIGNRGGNPARSNAYHSYGYYNLRDYGLADKKAGIEQLALRYPWIDVDKVGIFGHSGGGFMTAAALLLPPYNDFFKVGVSSAGNHDNNVYNQNWSEQHHGLREVPVRTENPPTGRTATPEFYDEGMDARWLIDPQFTTGSGTVSTQTKFEIKVPTNHELAANLKGHLLLVHGDMDNNVHPAGTVRLVNALIKANKRFDFMIMPGQAHGFGNMQPYFTQMLMEYFAEHLLGDYYRGTADMSNVRGD